MRIKNDDFDYARSAPVDVKASFRTTPKRVLLANAAKIFRFVTLGENATASGFWIAEPVYRHFRQWSSNSGLPISELARARLAVKLNWSSRMDTICSATLRRSIYCFQGPTHYQSRLDADPRFLAEGIASQPNVLLMGNFEQLWIPGISLDDFSIDSYGPADWKAKAARG